MQGIQNKTLDAGLALEENNVDIFCISESWFKEEEKDVVNISGYVLASSFSRTERIRGGSAIFTKSDVRFKIRKDICKLSVESVVEISCITLPDHLITVICFYRSPSSDFQKFVNVLEIALDKIDKNTSSLILAGDFNVNFLEKSGFSDAVIDLCQTYNMTKIINFATRNTSVSSTCIDNIFTNCKVILASSINCGLSDHDGQLINIKCNNKGRDVREFHVKRKITDSGLKHFQAALRTTSPPIVNISDPNEFYDIFIKWFLSALDTKMPPKKIYIKDKKTFNDWASEGIKISRARMFELHELRKIKSNPEFVKYVQMYKKIYKKVVWNAKQQYLQSLIQRSDNKIKAVWDVISKECGRCSLSDESVKLNINGTIISDATAVAELFSDHFNKLTVNENRAFDTIKTSSDLLLSFSNRNENSFTFTVTTPQEIINISKSLKNKNSTDLWSMSTKILKSSVAVVAEHLCTLFNMCLDCGVFPSKMKLAKVIPVHKKGARDDKNNYRPISLLPTFSKIFEKIILQQISNFFASNNILTPKQFGFRKSLSTIDAIAGLMEKLLSSLDKSKKTLGLFCDLSKAFDCVDHTILLLKLEHYGIRDRELNLIESYLQGRTQVTKIQNTVSKPQIITQGVPQGSILGPFLFLVYINDIPDCVISDNDEITLYADDTSLIFSDANLETLIKRIDATVKKLGTWFHVNRLSLNASKSNSVHFSLRPSQDNVIRIRYGENELENVDHIKFLGIHLDSKLQWSTHLDELSGKLSSATFAIKKIKMLCGFEAAKSVYFAYFHSLLSYGLMFWGMAANSVRIFRLQKRAIRNLFTISSLTSCRPYFIESGIMTMYAAYVYQGVMYARKNISTTLKNSDVHSHNTRNKQDLRPYKVRLSKVRNSFLYQSNLFYNKIPLCVRGLGDVHFKKKVQDILIKNPIYSIGDFDNIEFSTFS